MALRRLRHVTQALTAAEVADGGVRRTAAAVGCANSAAVPSHLLVFTCTSSKWARVRAHVVSQGGAQQHTVGPTAMETFTFDLQGFLLLRGVLSRSEVVALRTRLYEL